MPFGMSWHTLLDECDALDDEATLVMPLTATEFRITDVQEHRIVITETETGDAQPLQRDQFTTLADRISTPAALSSFSAFRPMLNLMRPC